MRLSRPHRLLRLAPVILVTGCLGWCDLDPFGLTERPIVGGYRLKQWEDGSYLFLTPADTGSTYYVQVTRLGWDRTHIVALLMPNGPEYPGGWTVIDAATGRTTRTGSAGDPPPDLGGTRIPTFRADSAWDRLGSRPPGA